MAPALLAVDREDVQLAQTFAGAGRPRARLDRALDLARLRLVGEAELLDLRAAILAEL